VLRYVLKRLAYCVLVVMGVVLLTFVMFNVAAGDPAAAALGKNPAPRETEELRRELGSDLPLLFGSRRKTEAFNSYLAADGKTVGNVELKKYKYDPQTESEAMLVFKRNFDTPGETVGFAVKHSGRIGCYDGNGNPLAFGEITPEVNELQIRLYPGTELHSVEFSRPNTSVFNSQFLRAMKELARVDGTAPYVHFLSFGRTLVTREPIDRILARGVVPSLCLMVPIFLGELVLGVVLALLAAACKDTWVDRTLLLASISLMSVSYLVVIIFAQWLLGYYYNMFPVWGWGGWEYLPLPIMIGILCGLGGGARFYRSVFVNELGKEYLRTARAKGCSPTTIYGKHLLRNAMIPIITRAGSVLPFLFTGSLLLESFFGIPGLGYAGLDALYNGDLQLLKALVVVSALLFVVINLATDIAYAWVDPRIRLT